MREIKFRAWDKENKKMVFIISLHNSFYLPFCIYSTSQSSDGITELDYDKCEVMQFTGLKDKNGKEIYEGDIIQFGAFGKKEVVFWEGCFVYMINEDKGHIFNPKEVKVIGNIYENPELLEEK